MFSDTLRPYLTLHDWYNVVQKYDSVVDLAYVKYESSPPRMKMVIDIDIVYVKFGHLLICLCAKSTSRVSLKVEKSSQMSKSCSIIPMSHIYPVVNEERKQNYKNSRKRSIFTIF